MINHLLQTNKGGGAESVVSNLIKISDTVNLKSRTVFLGESFWKITLNLIKLKSNGPLLIHSLRILIVSCILFKRNNRKYFFSHFNYNKLMRILIRILAFRQQIVCVGNVGYNKFLNDGIDKGKVILIHNVVFHKGTSIDSKKKQSKSFKEFCWIGSIKSGKNWEHLFPIADCLEKYNQRIVINIYGTGSDSNKLQNIITNHRSNNIKFVYHGFTKNVIDVLRNNDLLIYTAYNNYEMAPMILLEAELAGTKVAAYQSDVNKYYFSTKLPKFCDHSKISSLIINGGESVNSLADLNKTKEFLISL